MTAHAASQFDDAPQQAAAARFGVWLFLATEALVFSVLFVGYTAARMAHPGAFEEAGKHLYKWIGIGNAVVLLLSSGAVAAAVEATKTDTRRTRRWLLLAASLGGLFLIAKGIEYGLDARDSIVPLARFDPAEFTENPAHIALFYFFYWVMTGLHAIHVLAGIGVILAVRAVVPREGVSSHRANAVRGVGLYWHFVDIVWLFLLPLLYLNP